MAEALFGRLIASAPNLWDTYVGHEWMRAIHDGTLTRERFTFFLVQDMPYQTDFQNALVLGAGKSPEPATWLRLRDFIVAEADFEEELLADLGADWSYDRWAASPTREGYMNHLTRVALESSPGLIAAALLPCAAGFTGAMETPTDPDRDLDPLYRRWLDFYERPEQAEFSEALVGVFERAMAGASDAEVDEARMILQRSLYHQIAVFDAAWAVSDPWPAA